MFSRLVKEYADRQGVTEQIKAENQLLWVQKMNNIRACVWEVVTENIIFKWQKNRADEVWSALISNFSLS